MTDAEQWSASFGGDASAVYELTLVPTVFRPWAGILLDAADIGPGDHLLDVACGPGSVVVEAAPRVGPMGRVAGADPSETMLAIAAQRSPAVPTEWMCCPADTMPAPDDSFDVVTCQQGMQFFPDRPAALSEMRRVCRDGGRLAYSVWRPIDECPVFAGVAAGLAEVLGHDVAAAYRGGPWGWTEPAAMRDATTQAGFVDVEATTHVLDVRFDSVDQLAATVGAAPVGAQVEALSHDERKAFVQSVGRAVAPYHDDAGLIAPTASTIVTARA